MSSEVQPLLDEAMQHHRQGRLAEAKMCYENIVQQQPGHFTALHMLGVIACQQQAYSEGITAIEQALVINPQSLSAHNNVVSAYEKINDHRGALFALARWRAIAPANAGVHARIAHHLESIGLDEAALVFWDAAFACDTQSAYLIGKGACLLKQHQAAKALQCFQDVLAHAEDANSYANAAIALVMLNKPSDAMPLFDRALAIEPTNVTIAQNRALAEQVLAGAQPSTAFSFQTVTTKNIDHYVVSIEILLALQQLALAALSSEEAMRHFPDNKKLLHSAGLVQLALKRYKHAVDYFKRAIHLDSEYVDALINKATALSGLRWYEKAIETLESVLVLEPNNVVALNNLGSAWVELNQRKTALLYFDKALAVAPHTDYVLLNAAFCHLALEHFDEGWPLYEYRWRDELLRSRYYIPRPLWSGTEDLHGKTIFLYGEQGFGDVFHFVRYVNKVAERGAHILLGIHDSVKALCKRSFPFVELTDKSKPLPDVDYHCPLGSLPLAFHSTADTIPRVVPYLRCDDARMSAWAAWLGKKTKPRLGMMWRGNPDNPVEVKRHVPLEKWLPLLDMPVEFISLRNEVTDAEAQWFAQHGIRSAHERIHDFDDTAALIQQLDGVISTDTSVAHLTGALGVPLWIMLSLSADWRWHERGDSLWYPSALLFRQHALNQWEPVIAAVKDSVIKKIF